VSLDKLEMGKIKQGQGTVIGNAGEYLVVGELLKRGIIAAPAPRNSPGFDVLATNGAKSLNIRVKTKTEAADSWVWNCKNDERKTIFMNLTDAFDFTVLVDLKDVNSHPEYYIVPTIELDTRLRDIHNYWVKLPPKRGSKPHNPDDRMRRIGFSEHHRNWLFEHEGAWHLIIAELTK
jgi:hypothetical protein